MGAFWYVLLGLGVLIALLGFWLVVKARQEPCGALLRAVRAAEAACEAARLAAARSRSEAVEAMSTAARADDRATEAVEERREAESARRLEESAARQGGDSARGKSRTGAPDLREYEAALRTEAAARAKAELARALAAAATDGQRTLARKAHANRLAELERPEALDDLRRAARQNQPERLADVRARFDAALEAERAAGEASDAAKQAAGSADAQAQISELRADEACARLAAARQALEACLQQRSPDQAMGLAADPCGGRTDKWEWEGEPATFLILASGAKIRWSAQPRQDELEEWLDGFRLRDPAGIAVVEPPAQRGAEVDAFGKLGLAGIRRLFGSLADRPGRARIVITLPLEEIHLRCHGHFVCLQGDWVGREGAAAEWERPIPRPTPFVLDGPTPTVKDVYGLYSRALGSMRVAQRSARAADRFRAKCGSAK